MTPLFPVSWRVKNFPARQSKSASDDTQRGLTGPLLASQGNTQRRKSSGH
jgi:hypothetical protein